MKMERLNAWFGLAGNIAVLLGLVALAVEINANTKALGVQVSENSSALILERKLAFANNVDLQALYAKALLTPAELTPAELFGVYVYLELRMAIAERTFDRYNEGLETRASWEAALTSTSYYLGSTFGHVAWSVMREGYAHNPGLVAAIDGELAKTKGQGLADDEWLLRFHETVAALDL